MSSDANAITRLTASPVTPVADMGTCETAAALAEALTQGDLLLAAADEPRARSIYESLRALAPDAVVAFVPSSDALPGEAAPASPANVGERVSSLRRVRQALAAEDRLPVALITTGEAIARAYPPPDAFAALPPSARVGAPVDLTRLCGELEEIGYFHDERVDEPGEIALRGQVLDIFPADAACPLRIEEQNGTIIGIKIYDPFDQRTIEALQHCEIGRASEPLLQDGGVSLLAHLPQARIMVPAAADDRRKRFLALSEDAARHRPQAVPAIITEERWQEVCAAREILALHRLAAPPPRFAESRSAFRQFVRLARAERDAGNHIVIIGSARDLRFLQRRIGSVMKEELAYVTRWRDIPESACDKIKAIIAPADRGFYSGGPVSGPFAGTTIMAIAAADLLGSRAETTSGSTLQAVEALSGFGDIRIDDIVVHEDHGIGRVAGLEPMPALPGESEGSGGDAIVLAYADDNLRLVPVAEADRIWRYGAEADAVTLDRLDGSSWHRRRADIDAAIAESARALSELAAARDSETAPVLDPPSDAYERFAAGFPFTETPDQAKAIAAVRDDLAAGKPMDRLVIGDVGYGKTEIALRAAAIAALSGKQVALAAPTTVLARQHLETFAQRFAGSGIIVAGLSRLVGAAQARHVKAGLADGSVHIVIGTGAVAGKTVCYKDLGLVIVDEEQRFGTRDKEKLRAMSAGHMLSLSATPIPRTLQNALIGLQQLSVIATPPARRQPIRTTVGTFDTGQVRSAILREKARGGQSFVVVPRIEDMEPVAERLGRLMPELELLQAHGRMPAGEIDEAMVRFGRGEGDILLATNIIEAGLDVPRANTMVIWRADRFGLSQLHQLRGRVGRASRRGHVMLLTDPDASIAPRTMKRLRTLEAFDRLGAGFAISARDLDMRGAGDLLGDAQAGHMKLIGIDLYQFLLEAALRTTRGEQVERWTPELNLGVGGTLPESWVPNPELRVTLYARLARIDDAFDLDAFAEELEDRFGAMPEEARRLLALARVRVSAKAASIARIDAGPAAIALTPAKDFAGNAAATPLVRKGDRLLLPVEIADPDERLEQVAQLVEMLLPEGST
ncbi:TRCF domain-containing protein [Croceicoccus sp. F390]|uniref:Transcription-repair-coupling factor n=1 Tax=Croceicoccus esteveae TaxID=3075597 RepID=A0ABU2ZHQ6_9SPHN|nr:DEAD/DEAH box helicase [Croceicoccus sp. F390]MDT0576125.1 TRCF domain-containing protein [Croceicoccus sp. F390]